MDARRVALVTGAARRVGRAIVRRLAGSGFDVLLTYLTSRVEAEQLVRELRDGGSNAVAVRADLTQPEAAVGEIGRVFAESFGRLDVLVNNASIYEPGRLEQAGLEQSRRLMAIHCESPLLLCRHFAPLLRQRGGHVVNMLDLLAERPWPEYLAYCASKAALMNLTRSLARELAPEVTVNGIAPGVVDWPEDYPHSDREKYLRRVPLGRAGTPEDVAALVHFLVTEGAYLTGQVIRLDGGRSVS